MSQTYHEQIDYKNTMKLRELQKELPAFADDFFRAMEIKKATNTRRNYAYDLSTFFYFLRTTNSYFRDKDLRTLPVSILDAQACRWRLARNRLPTVPDSCRTG